MEHEIHHICRGWIEIESEYSQYSDLYFRYQDVYQEYLLVLKSVLTFDKNLNDSIKGEFPINYSEGKSYNECREKLMN